MMQSNINLPSLGMTPIAIATLSNNVVSKMTDNPHFPNPVVSLKLIAAKTLLLQVAITKAIGGSRLSRLERDRIASEVNTLLRTLVNDVRTIGNGDRAILASSGFELSKTPVVYGVPGSPVIKVAKMTGISGEVLLRWGRQNGAHLYQVWITDTDPAIQPNWQPVSASRRVTVVIDSLESYKAYWFCVSAIGAAGEGGKSDPTIARAA